MSSYPVIGVFSTATACPSAFRTKGASSAAKALTGSSETAITSAIRNDTILFFIPFSSFLLCSPTRPALHPLRGEIRRARGRVIFSLSKKAFALDF